MSYEEEQVFGVFEIDHVRIWNVDLDEAVESANDVIKKHRNYAKLNGEWLIDDGNVAIVMDCFTIQGYEVSDNPEKDDKGVDFEMKPTPAWQSIQSKLKAGEEAQSELERVKAEREQYQLKLYELAQNNGGDEYADAIVQGADEVAAIMNFVSETCESTRQSLDRHYKQKYEDLKSSHESLLAKLPVNADGDAIYDGMSTWVEDYETGEVALKMIDHVYKNRDESTHDEGDYIVVFIGSTGREWEAYNLSCHSTAESCLKSIEGESHEL